VEGSDRRLFSGTISEFALKDQRQPRKIPVMRVGGLAEFRNRHLWSRNQKSYPLSQIPRFDNIIQSLGSPVGINYSLAI
jgi:hypothetical protein